MRKQRTRKWIAISTFLVLAAALLIQQLFPAAGASAEVAKQAEETAGGAAAEDAAGQNVTPADGEAAEATEAAAEETAPGGGADAGAPDSGTEAGAAAGEAAPAEGEVAMYPVTATTKVLENASYTLYIDEKTGNVRLVGKATGREWLGSPIVPRTTMPNNKKFMDSPVHISFTEGADITTTYSLKEQETTFDIRKEQDAVSLDFKFGLQGISFTMEYRLTDNGLEVTIPYDSIKEEGKGRLIGIEPLPFLNAAEETDEGAMLLPDGSGALLHFRTDHPMYLKGYSEYIYGPDYSYITHTHDMIDAFGGGRRAITPRQFATMPVFGMYRNGTGTLGIVTKGEFDAKINGTPAGIRAIPLYRSSVEFIYRKNDVIFIGSSGQIPYYQGAKIEGDRQVRYVLLEGDKAGYEGMAEAYRSYLTEERGIQPVADQNAAMQVKLLGGILRDEILGSTFIRMTTFDQAKAIIDELKSKGIDRLELTYDGWSKNGLYGNQPAHFPAAKQLGGKDGLKELAQYAEEQGVGLYLRTNYAKAYEESDGFKKKVDAIRGMDREVLEANGYYLATRWRDNDYKFYYMKPERVYDKRIAKEREQFAKLGIDGVQFQYLGDLLYSDQDPDRSFSRAQTAEVWVKALDDMRGTVGKSAVDYGYAYTFGSVDRIDNVPLSHSGYIYTDEAVPFYQLVVHGLIPYYAGPSNLREDRDREMLRAIEYGAMPSYELTFAPTSKLQRTMETRLFSSEAGIWSVAAAEEYKRVGDLFRSIAGQQMTGHEKLQDGVYRTSYANGVQVIVNYNAVGVQAGGVQVAAMDFAVAGR